MGDRGGASVARQARPGFGVAASPLNGVKLELGLVLLGAVVAWIAVHRLLDAGFLQPLVLAGYGLLGMGWLVWRARRVVNAAVGEVANGPQQEQ